MTRKKLFICYLHTDRTWVLERLDWLREANYEPWFDEQISGGSVCRDAISDAIADSAALVYYVPPVR